MWKIVNRGKQILYFSNMHIFYLEVFQLDLQVPFMVHVFLSQENSMAVVGGLPKNLDGDLNVKVDLTFTALLKYRGPCCYNTAAISDL